MKASSIKFNSHNENKSQREDVKMIDFENEEEVTA